MTTTIPAVDVSRTRGFDSSAAFLLDGYRFGQRRFARFGAPYFSTRILGRAALVVKGADAARAFYENDHFSRDRAMPTSVVHLLQDEGSVQALSAEPHFHRKQLFVRLLASDRSIDEVVRIFGEEWELAVAAWPERVVLLESLWPVLTRTALRWVGIPLERADVAVLARQLQAMVDSAGAFGPKNWRARAMRLQAEEWARAVIEDVRSDRLVVDEGSAVHELAHHRDSDGAALTVETAAVELINVLRPVGAIARFITFEAHALRVHPGVRSELRSGSLDTVSFVHEVRRYYPFFPVIGGRVRMPFEWHGIPFEVGEWVLLDLFATNRDEATWTEAERFLPHRFDAWKGDPNTLVPQGAGDVSLGHRCPGERATIEIMAEAARRLIALDGFSVPPQDLRISLRSFPAAPESGFVLERRD